METEKRLDVLLCELGFFDSRTKAQSAIAEGRVSSEGKMLRKPSQKIPSGTPVEVSQKHVYVGRGAYKLLAAIDAFGIDPKGKVCLDVGASTGGFTQVWLEHGAKHVFSVDVGTNQLAPSLREDPRVTPLEQTDIRALPAECVKSAELCSVDVSFISLSKILPAPAVFQVFSRGGSVAALIKPQFEAGRASLNKHGVVKSQSDHIRAVENVILSAQNAGYTVSGLIPSPISGGDGNTEYLLFLSHAPAEIDPAAAVKAALSDKKQMRK